MRKMRGMECGFCGTSKARFAGWGSTAGLQPGRARASCQATPHAVERGAMSGGARDLASVFLDQAGCSAGLIGRRVSIVLVSLTASERCERSPCRH
jgi:hypothetical protein